jgi:hypothetical protein
LNSSEALYRPVRVYEALVAVLILAIALALVATVIDRSTEDVVDRGAATAGGAETTASLTADYYRRVYGPQRSANVGSGSATTSGLPSTASLNAEDYQGVYGQDSP